MTDERFKLVLKAEPNSNIPPVIRLRRLLKYSLRVCKLRCVRCEPINATTSDQKTRLIEQADAALKNRAGPSQGA